VVGIVEEAAAGGLVQFGRLLFSRATRRARIAHRVPERRGGKLSVDHHHNPQNDVQRPHRTAEQALPALYSLSSGP